MNMRNVKETDTSISVESPLQAVRQAHFGCSSGPASTLSFDVCTVVHPDRASERDERGQTSAHILEQRPIRGPL